MEKFNIKKITVFIPLLCLLFCSSCDDNTTPARVYSFNTYHPEIGEKIDIDKENDRFVINFTNIYDYESHYLDYYFSVSKSFEESDDEFIYSSKEESENTFYCTDVNGNRVTFDSEYGQYNFLLKTNETIVFYLYYKNAIQKVKDYINDDGKLIKIEISGCNYWRCEGVY